MAILHVVKKNHYQDSMKLMQISQKLSGEPGVKNAAAIMATEANLAMLKDAGLLEGMPEATANDLIVAVKADSKEKAEEAVNMLDSLLAPPDAGAELAKKYKSLGSAYGALPGANLVAVSLPGKFAKLEVGKAIDTGLHTFLFSDNLTIDEEIELKERARERGLLVMGPGCGTAIVNGVGLGFANVLDRGPVGMVAAS
ncbi:MAG: succinyl-CoA synthetase subunit alpha, partial [Candidatus Dadabacteria bacterium]|nr:succinyl-CoA synthetase subunit alpha [Candidatus Dadabacteria bacterium]